MKYHISTLMFLVFAAAIICGVAMQDSFIAFGIGLVALGLLSIRLMYRSSPRDVTVHETTSEIDAHMLRNYLADHGVEARVEGGQSAMPYPGLIPARVIVPRPQVEQTAQLLREFLRSGHEN